MGLFFGLIEKIYLFIQFLGLMFFSVFRKLSSAGDTKEKWDAIQGLLDKLEKYVHVNVVKFSKAKVLYPGQGDPRQGHRLGVALPKRTWGCC